MSDDALLRSARMALGKAKGAVVGGVSRASEAPAEAAWCGCEGHVTEHQDGTQECSAGCGMSVPEQQHRWVASCGFFTSCDRCAAD
jgi:hypothetical protein